MADGPDKDQKTEAPTDKRRREAAERGEIWQSREFGTAMVTLGGVAWLGIFGAALVDGCRIVLARGLTLRPGREVDVGAMLAPLAWPLLLFAAMVMVSAVAGPLLLGSRWSGKAATPKFSRVDPLAGLKRMANLNGLGELGKSLVKAVLLGAAGWYALGPLVTGAGSLGGAATRVGAAALGLLAWFTAALFLIAAIDLPWTRMRWMAKLRMSRQDVIDERKESDGNPEVRAAQRRQARAGARRALRPAMAEATVVTINPSEFAVALRYLPGRDPCPIIVAKGQGAVAAAIRDLAAERRVPMLRYPALTRAIYFTGTVGSPIRDDLYGPVAAVLAYVFSVDAGAPPIVEVPASARYDAAGQTEAG